MLFFQPEQGRRCGCQDVAAVWGPGQEGDAASSDTLQRYAALCSDIPNLKHASISKEQLWKQEAAQSERGLKEKQLPRTIMEVSSGEADTRRDPLGDQAMDVTGE